MAERKDIWWAAGEAYDPYVGRWSRLVAVEFLDWLDLEPGLAWLDVGCGTGALTAAILAHCAPRRVTGVDFSADFLAVAKARVEASRATFRIGDAQALPVPDRGFDAAVSGLVLNFVPDQARAVAELRRAVRPGGTIALYVWDYAGEMQLSRRFWEAAVALDSSAVALHEGVRFPVCRPEPLEALFKGAELAGVESRAIDVPTIFGDFDDYWSPFLCGQGPAGGYCVSLSEEQRAGLRERLRATLPAECDGSIRLVARAWAVRGTVGG